jgi:hypothetical protein
VTRRVRERDLTDADRDELERFRMFIGMTMRANAAGGRDAQELYDAHYGPDGSGEDRRDFTRKQ